MKHAIAFAVILLLSGCAASTSLPEKTLEIQQGHTKADVLRVLGSPGNRQFREDDEAWQYCATAFDKDSFVIVWFHEGIVTGMTTYTHGPEAGYIGDCSQGYRTIEWDDAPDRTIEIRNR